ncbi:hypothetical protein VTH82DRAFT_8348 [Thermothelomyces myriococcoides]
MFGTIEPGLGCLPPAGTALAIPSRRDRRWVFGFQEQMPAPGQTFSSMELTLCGLWTEHTEDVVTRVRWMQV